MPPAFRESVRYGEQNFYTRARELVGDRDPRAHEFSVQLRAMDTELAGEAARLLGAGRKRKDDVIDPAVGYMTFRRLGDRVEAGEEVARLFHNDEKLAEQAEEALLNALTLSSGQIIPAPWVLARIDQDGKESSL